MSQTKVQLIAPIGIVTASTVEITGVVTATTLVGDIAGTVTGITSTTDNLDVGIVTATAFVGDFTGTASSIVTGSNVTAGIITGTKFVGNATGTVSGLADDTNINVGILTSTSFVGDLTGNAAGLSTTTANLSLGIVTATSFAGNITGNAAGISVTTTNANLGIVTASAFHGSGANLSGVSAGPVGQQAVNANSGTTTIDLSSGNVIYMTQTSNTTVSFANTEGNTDVVYLIRKPDGTARTLTWPSGFNWNGASEPTLASGSDDYQVFKLTTRDNGATWYGTVTAEKTFVKELWVWGSNTYGNLGTNKGPAQLISASSPVQLPGTTWKYITSTTRGSKAIKTDGTLWAWGRNHYGQLGVNNRTNYSSPVQIPGTTWAVVRGQQYQNIATKTDGTLWSWGYNAYGGGLGQNNIVNYSSPVQIPGTTWSTSSDGISAGNAWMVALKTDGTLWGCGGTGHGQLGQNTNEDAGTDQFSSPVQIPGTTWSSIATTNQTTLMLKTDGTLWGTGVNGGGQLGQNTAVSYSSPVQIGTSSNWSKISAISGSTFGGIKKDGTLWTWGSNDGGAIGMNEEPSNPFYQISSPIQIPGEWESITSAGLKTPLASKRDGTLWTWGGNDGGVGGLGNQYMYSSPVQLPGNWTLDDIVGRNDGYNIAAFRKPLLN